jgi:DNA-binding NtrC family response regulator
MMAQKRFRRDLYYRIRGGWLHLPPLRERKEDIPVLVHHFLEAYCAPSSSCGIHEDALCRLVEYAFPGNIRELKSIIQSAANLSQGKPISTDALPGQLSRPKAVCRSEGPSDACGIIPLEQIEKAHILDAYRRLNGNKSRTARMLGIGLNTLRRKLKAFGIT